MHLWIGLMACTAAIVFSGSRLSRYGDIIAEKTGLGGTWIGVVLMASVTSLPELVTGISSVTFARVPDIAVGDVLGSCVFNMLILAILDALYPAGPISTKANQGHVLSAAFGIMMLSIAAASLFLGHAMPSIGWIGGLTIPLMLIYLLAMRLIFTYEKRRLAEFIKETAREYAYKDVALKSVLIKYVANALVVIGAALFLPKIGQGIAEATGLGQTFVGNIFIALSTSLPEVVVSVAAVRMGAVDMAIGNLFGSNVFNVFILALDDLFFVRGPLLQHVSPSHMTAALSAIVMTAIGVVGLTYRTEKKRLFMAWDSIAIVAIYLINLMLLYSLK